MAQYSAIPIPTYEEAIAASPRPSTSLSTYRQEGESLLAHAQTNHLPVPSRRANYRPPSVEEIDDEDDAYFLTPAGDRVRRDGRDEEDSEDDEVRREMEEMEIDDTYAASFSSRRSLSAWGKRIQDLSQSLTSRMGAVGRGWHLPRIRMGSWRGGSEGESIATDDQTWNWRRPCAQLSATRIDANFCILLGRIFAIFLVVGIVWLLFMSDFLAGATRGMAGQMFEPESVREHVQSMVDANRIRSRLEKLSHTDHMAGTEGGFATAEYVKELFTAAGLDSVGLEEWEVYMNFPTKTGRKVELLDSSGNVEWTASLEESSVYNDETRKQPASFYTYARQGIVEGPLIYAHAGTQEDFRVLVDNGIMMQGAIALIRNHASVGDVALKVKAAELVGFAGCLVYSDPADGGFSANGKVAPAGRGMPAGGVQRGSMALTNWVMGDPLTPGYASTHGAKRLSPDDNVGLVNIPSLPIPWSDAQQLLKAIQVHGMPAPDGWVGGIPDTDYWTGGDTSPRVRLNNEQESAQEQKIYNVVGRIPGVEQKSKSVVLGARRDAFSYGASSTAAGTAVLLEIVDLFSDLLRRGWRPLRTIEFISWDGGQYNALGATEHVENDLERLRKDTWAYINLDHAVSGNRLRASGSPVFDRLLRRVLGRVGDPREKKSLGELWQLHGSFLEGLGTKGDYAPWQHIAGTSSLDLRFEGARHPMHSAYDSFEWLDHVGDPGTNYHHLLTQVIGLLLLELSDRMVFPFDVKAYATRVSSWVEQLGQWVRQHAASCNTQGLVDAAVQFRKDAERFEQWEEEYDAVILGSGGFESMALASHRESHNARMGNLETHLLDLDDGGGVSRCLPVSCSPTCSLTMHPDSQPHTVPPCHIRPAALVE